MTRTRPAPATYRPGGPQAKQGHGVSTDDWMYAHLPLEQQLDQYGVRSVELDVYPDPEGGG